MKDFGKPNFFLMLHIEHFQKKWLFLYQSSYTEKILKHFYMNKACSLASAIVVLSLDEEKYTFHPLENGENILGLEASYLIAIKALTYVANYTRPI